jgi:prepilin-type N-terminal cleavage/methylation domain-containing protein
MSDTSRGHDDEGFSLVELMMVVAILGIFVAVAIVSYTSTTEASRKVACLSNQRAVRTGILEYQVDRKGGFPETLEDVHPLVQWQDGFGRCVSSGLEFTYDKYTGEVTCPTPSHQIP